MNKDAVAEMSQQYQVETAEKLVPAGYKQTEVGVIPEDWEVLALGEIGTFKNGINKGADDFGHGSPFVNLMDVFGKPSISHADHLGLINSTDLDRKEYSLEVGDVLFIRSSVKPSGVGLTSVVLKDLINTVYSGFLIRFRSSDSLSVKFKKFCFYEEEFRKRIISSSTVSANTNINQDALKAIPLAFPRSLKEQDAIANALSDTDALLSELEKLIAKKQAIKTATMQQLLTGRTRLPQFAHDSDGSKKGYKQSELGEIPEDWDVISFDEVALRINTKKNQISASDYQSYGSYPVVDQGKKKIVGYSDLECKVFKVSDAGVIVFGDHTCIVKYVDFSFLVGADGVQVISGREGCNTRFLSYVMSFFPVEPTGYNRHYGALREFVYSFPKQEEQTAIASILSDMDEEIQALEQRLNKTRQIKQGMMQELLTGKTRLLTAELSK
ncbi:MAG: hypothetical protein GXZ10_02015 [Gammaproteobacteria bacterium]|nr:hypothetical protein [Gammaproteobacteria bacterium]